MRDSQHYASGFQTASSGHGSDVVYGMFLSKVRSLLIIVESASKSLPELLLILVLHKKNGDHLV
ncbi:predicted protein [Arabidopsis lyrata subsp. lyrata]|uniref:Predicted protein n=1 Tax=Arabidopsis lyrata subsp. lyrata TaxID=81972 RepID=D7KVE5_ARALL|nr:predicted protein [Arabidopsis lyrata subsp. lyrata]